MGNLGSYFSLKESSELLHTSDGVVDSRTSGSPIQRTPTRFNNVALFDPRSPTIDIDRTPIMIEEEPMRDSEDPSFSLPAAAVDPRSPTAGITRTPVALDVATKQSEIPAVSEGLEDLIQVLNFTDLDNLSLSDIEAEEEEELSPKITAPLALEETLDLTASLTVPPAAPSITSTPSRASTKVLSNKARRGSDENSFCSGKSPTGNTLFARNRVPFGDVNRPALVASSPRVQLQTKQKLNIRSELQQHQHHRLINND